MLIEFVGRTGGPGGFDPHSSGTGPRSLAPRRLHLIRCFKWPADVQTAMAVVGRAYFEAGTWYPMNREQ